MPPVRRTPHGGPGERRGRSGQSGHADDRYDDTDGYADEDFGYDDGGPAERTAGAGLSAEQVGREALRQIAELTGRKTESVISLEPVDEGWLVGVETVEDHRVPSSIDLLGLYLVELDEDGELIAYRRIRRYPRGKSEVS